MISRSVASRVGLVLAAGGLAGLCGGIFSEEPWVSLAATAILGGSLLVLKPLWGLLLFTAVSPVRGVFGHEGPILSPSKLLAALVAVGWLLRLLVGQKRIFLGTSHRFALGLLVFALVSLLWSADRQMSASGLASLIGLVGIFLVVPQLVESWEDFAALSWAMCAGQAILALIAIYYAATGVSFSPQGPEWLPWIGSNRAYVGHTLYFSIFLSFVEFARPTTQDRRRVLPRAVAFVLLLLSLVAAVSMGSRIFVVAFSITLIPFAWSLYRSLGRRTLSRILAPVLVVVLVGGAFVAPFAYEKFRFTVQNLGAAILEDNPRLDIWRTHFEVLKDHPVLGVGFDVGSKVYMEYAPQIRQDQRFILGAHGEGVSAHSLYLTFFVELGIVGFLLFVAFLIALCWELRRALRMASGPFERGIGLAIAFSLLALLLAGLGESLADKAFLWFGFALIPTYVRLLKRQSRSGVSTDGSIMA